jgi:hypothetical protein
MTTRRVQIMVGEGVIPKPDKKGQYDFYECTHRYIDFLKERAHPKSKLDEEIKQIKKEKERFSLEREKGLYILKDEVAGELVKRVVILKRDFKVLENRLSKYPEAKDIVKKAHFNMMSIYSKKTGALRHGKK